MKKILAAVLVVALLAALAVRCGLVDSLIVRMLQRQAERTLSGASFAALPDGLNVILCGAGSPLPDTLRSESCLAVVAGRRLMVVDAGASGARNMTLYRLPVGRISDVFITHFHSDHIDGLGEMMTMRWTNGAQTQPLPVHGPPGIEQVVAGFNMAYAQDDGYREAHHGPVTLPPGGEGGVAVPFLMPAPGESVTVLDQDGLKVIAFAVSHAPVAPAVGYRFDYGGRSVVISGDTIKSDNLQHFATGADLLVHEAMSPELMDALTEAAGRAGAANIQQILRDVRTYHSTPVEAAQLAQAAGVRHLLYYHIAPALPYQPLERIFLHGVAQAYHGGVTVGRNGTWIALPAHSEEVRVGRR
jgi:ribonuclease Z